MIGQIVRRARIRCVEAVVGDGAPKLGREGKQDFLPSQSDPPSVPSVSYLMLVIATLNVLFNELIDADKHVVFNPEESLINIEPGKAHPVPSRPGKLYVHRLPLPRSHQMRFG